MGLSPALQLLRRGRGADIGALQQLEQAAVEQEARLRGVAQHVEPGVLRRQRNAAEVDMCRDVLGSHVHQRVGIGAVRAVAHQRTAAALRVVVLGLGEAVVDEEGGAAPQAPGQGANEGLGLRVDLGYRAGREGAGGRRPQHGGAVGPGESRTPGGHAALEPLFAVPAQQLHRHRVEHLVADDHAVQGFGPGVEPAHTFAESGQPFGLPLAQGAGQVDDRIPAHAFAQAAQQLRRQRARTGAEFKDFVGLRGSQRLRHLARQRLTEQRREFGCGDEVAA